MQIAFPALVISEDSVIPTDDATIPCTNDGWKTRFFEEWVYFDSNGVVWRVVDAAATEASPQRTNEELITRIRIAGTAAELIGLFFE